MLLPKAIKCICWLPFLQVLLNPSRPLGEKPLLQHNMLVLKKHAMSLGHIQLVWALANCKNTLTRSKVACSGFQPAPMVVTMQHTIAGRTHMLYHSDDGKILVHEMFDTNSIWKNHWSFSC